MIDYQLLHALHAVISEQGFEKAMKEQKARSRAASSSSAEDWTEVNNLPIDGFIGYDHLEAQVKLVRYRTSFT